MIGISVNRHTPLIVASPRSFTSLMDLVELSLRLLIPSGREGLRPSPEDETRRVTVGLVGVNGVLGATGDVGIIAEPSMGTLIVGDKSTMA